MRVLWAIYVENHNGFGVNYGGGNNVTYYLAVANVEGMCWKRKIRKKISSESGKLSNIWCPLPPKRHILGPCVPSAPSVSHVTRSFPSSPSRQLCSAADGDTAHRY